MYDDFEFGYEDPTPDYDMWETEQVYRDREGYEDEVDHRMAEVYAEEVRRTKAETVRQCAALVHATSDQAAAILTEYALRLERNETD